MDKFSIDIYEIKSEIRKCERPYGWGSKKHAKACRAFGLYKVHIDGLDNHYAKINSGFYMVRKEFAQKLLWCSQRIQNQDGIMFAQSKLTVETFYEQNEFISISFTPE